MLSGVDHRQAVYAGNAAVACDGVGDGERLVKANAVAAASEAIQPRQDSMLKGPSRSVLDASKGEDEPADRLASAEQEPDEYGGE
jgi:hypothetical protein